MAPQKNLWVKTEAIGSRRGPKDPTRGLKKPLAPLARGCAPLRLSAIRPVGAGP